MKRFTLVLGLLGLMHILFGQSEWDPGKLDGELYHKIENQPVTYHPIYLVLADQIDMIAMNEKFNQTDASLQERTYSVITSLQALADATQGPILSVLENLDGIDPATVQPYWVTNVIYVEANADAVKELSKRYDISSIQHVPPLAPDKVTPSPEPVMQKRSAGGHEKGHEAIRATDMWALGFTGNGRKALIIDSGANLDHPALNSNYHGNFVADNLAWFSTSVSPQPSDCDNNVQMCCHGTHVSGTVVGLDRNTNDTIGVAFNATWMSAGEIGCGNNNAIGAMQWAINPDNNPGTIDDQPDVINNSWGYPGPPLAGDCNDVTQSAINAAETAGIAVVTSAGNDGSASMTVTGPGFNAPTLVNSFTVGAISPFSPNYPIAGFSSRGPSVCNGLAGSLLIKPEVSAPGVNIRSSVEDNSYAGYSGTSMASPHVSGGILLLKEAFPTLTGETIKLALYNTAVDLGTPGEDNNYGMGIIDLVAAYNYLISQGNTPVIPSLDKDVSIREVSQQDEVACGLSFVPEVVLRNDGKTTVSTVDLNYTFSGGTSGSFQWAGSIPPGQIQIVQLPAVSPGLGRQSFDVEVMMVDGVSDAIKIDNKKSGSVILFPEEKPVVDTLTACLGLSTILNASHSDTSATLRWFSSPTSNNGLADGNVYITPPIATQTVYYVGVIQEGNMGLKDNSGGGFTFPTATGYLSFDVFYPVRIKSVKVYATGAGTRSIVLRNSNNVTLDSEIVNLPDGESIVDLDFSVPPGKGFRLGLGGGMGNLLTASAASYPYNFDNIINITGSDNGLYPYFFDWEVEYESSCERSVSLVGATAGSVFPAFVPSDTVVDISDGRSVKFNNASNGAQSYLWDFGDGTTSTLESPRHNYFFPGTYNVTLSVTSSEGCVAGTVETVRVVGAYPYSVSVDDILADIGSIDIIPNPTSGKFQVFFDLKKMIEADVSVFNLVGQRVQNIGSRSYRQDKLSFDLSDQTPGIYYLKINFNDQQIVKKVVVRND
jgi:subtilisin family serine protease